jgi:hypothetical protein
MRWMTALTRKLHNVTWKSIFLNHASPLRNIFVPKGQTPRASLYPFSKANKGSMRLSVSDGDFPPNRPKRRLSGAGYGVFEGVVQPDAVHG